MTWPTLAGLILAGSITLQAQSKAPALASADSSGALKSQTEEPATNLAEHPTEAIDSAQKEGSFTGRFGNTKLMVQLKPATNTWLVTITAAHLRLAYKGELNDGKISGTCNQVPITTSMENNVLKLATGGATTYLRRVDLPKLEGVYQSDHVKLDFQNAHGGTNGMVHISGNTLPFTASECAGDLVGVFTNDGQTISFVLANELTGLWFQSENVSEQMHWIRSHPSTPVFDHANRWTNSLGMVLVSVPGIEVRFSIWDTREQDYEAYSRSVAGVDAMWKSRETDGFHITNWAIHPVTMVNWNDAKAFCQWLTEQERAEGLLATNQTYRLPTNEEWSKAMGLTDDVATRNIYPWGNSWPPPPAFGNYADSTLTNYSPNLDFIEGYDDGFATTSPVGSFKANVNGLFDMSGNVWQWCEDEYVNLIPGRVLRRGAWNTNDRESLAGAYRGSFLPNSRNTIS